MHLLPLRSHATALALCAFALLPAGAQTLPAEVQVAGPEVIDFEFDWGRDGVYCPSCNGGAGNARQSFIDRDHNLWVGYVDYYTGNFKPSDGKAVLVDTNAVAPVEIGNGPEWMTSQRGSEIVYSRWTDGAPRSPANMQLGFARQGKDGWIAGPVDGSFQRTMPVGTMDVADLVPTVHYQNVAIGNIPATIFWRDVVQGSLENKLPITNNDPGMTRRWIPGSRDMIITAPALNPVTGTVNKQVFLYSTTAGGRAQQVTFDAIDKLWAFMWKAPEYGNENVFFVMVGGKKIQVYRNFPKPNLPQNWRVVNTIDGPASTPYISSPEPFVHNGRSWIFFSISANPDLHDFVPSRIAVASADVARPEMRILTSVDSPLRARRDPEYFITANGPYIYYNRYILGPDGTQQISEGVYRVDTGLGPPVAP